MRDYIKNADYERAFPIPDTDHWFWECKHCSCYCGSEEGIIEHLDTEHWWLRNPEEIVVP